MNLSQTQRALFLLGMVLAIALLPLVGGLHHHDHGDGASEMCWFCTTATSAVLPVSATQIALAVAWAPFFAADVSAPSRFPWMAQYRRGPPSLSLA
jgi:hypothetical protein